MTATRNTRPTFAPTLETLEARAVPATLVNGDVRIVGSDAADYVWVQDMKVNNVAMIQVVHNNRSQTFEAAKVTGRVMFWGYGSGDTFSCSTAKRVYADGGTGDDTLCGDRGDDLLVGGAGNDTLEGWGGKDELQGDNSTLADAACGRDLLDGGSGDDTLFGQGGDDVLGGRDGDDRLVGGAGSDIAFGGLGSDQFWTCNDRGFFVTGKVTRFGTASVGGVQDFRCDPYGYYSFYVPEYDQLWS